MDDYGRLLDSTSPSGRFMFICLTGYLLELLCLMLLQLVAAGTSSPGVPG